MMTKQELEQKLAAEIKWRDAELEKLRAEIRELQAQQQYEARVHIAGQGMETYYGDSSVRLQLECVTFVSRYGGSNYTRKALMEAFKAFITKWNLECHADETVRLDRVIRQKKGDRK